MADAIMLHNLDVHQLEQLLNAIVKGQIEIALNVLKNEKNEILLTREETFRLLKIDSTTLWYWTKAGKVKVYGIGNRRYYKKSEVLECLIPLKN